MANRSFSTSYYSVERAVVELFCDVTFGATGAPTIKRGKGIKSIVRNAAGDYTITLSDQYQALLGVDVRFISPAALGPATPNVFVKSANVNANPPTIRVAFNAAAGGALTEVAQNDEAVFVLKLSNSSF